MTAPPGATRTSPDGLRPGTQSRGERSAALAELVRHLSPRTLRELAALKEARDPSRLARLELDDEAIESLASILLKGDRPSVGWWRRHRPARETRGAAKPTHVQDLEVGR